MYFVFLNGLKICEEFINHSIEIMWSLRFWSKKGVSIILPFLFFITIKKKRLFIDTDMRQKDVSVHSLIF